MPEFALRTHLAHPPRAVWDWHLRPGAFERLAAPWDPVEIKRWSPVEPGAVQELVVHRGRAWSWVARITEVVEGESFTDVQESGPFARWEHQHRFLAHEGGGTDLEDRVRWAPPLGSLGEKVAGGYIARDLARVFAFRHARTGHDLDRHARFADQSAKRIALTGSSGFVGGDLSSFLAAGGHELFPLVRRPVHTPREIHWKPTAEAVDARRLEGVHAVVHLAGEPLVQRWTEEAKRRIRDSRVIGTRLLCETLAGLDKPPAVLVAASAVGLYGDRGDEVLDERAPAGTGFLAEVAQEWEEATRPARAAGIRVVNLRTGIVLDPRGGMLGILKNVYRFGLGGRIGPGTQYVPWIALDDLVGLIHHCLFDDTISGPVNAVAPNPTRQRELARTLADVLDRPTLVRVPAAEIELVLGEFAREMLLAGQRVRPARAKAAGFEFLHPDLEGALRFLFGRPAAS